MSILKEYVKGDIKNNRKSYNSTRITIFLAVVILSTFLFGVFSYFKSFLDMPDSNMGGSHFRIISEISNKDANNLVLNRHIDKIGFFNTRELDLGFGSREKTKILNMDDNALSTVKSSIKEGELPKNGQVMLSDNMTREIGKEIGDNIEIEENTYYISGIYYDKTPEYQGFYQIYLNSSQDTLLHSKQSLSPFIWYKNIRKTYNLSQEIIDNLQTKDIVTSYNDFYLNRSFVFDPDKSFLKDYISHILTFVLFIILLSLFYSILVNLFLVQESKAIVEYSKLKSIGATNKDISRILKLKVSYIAQLPIIIGIMTSLILVKILFLILNEVDKYFSNGEDIYSVYMHLNLKLDFKLVLFVYILSLLIIYISTKKPIKKLKTNTIIDGLKQDIKGKSYRKHDLKYKGNIEKDLSRQFYNNSKYDFRFTSITLKIGFLLMTFIMIAFTYYSMDKEYNSMSKYKTYDIQAEYVTLNPLNKDLMKKIKNLEVEDLVNFRKESVYLYFDKNLISDKYKNEGNLNNLEKQITSFDNMRVEIFGIEDEKFKELVLKEGLDPSNYVGNKVLLLNTMADDFDIPVSDMKNIKFLKDEIKELYFSEYPNDKDVETIGHEFTLNIEDKIDTPLFDYPTIIGGLNIYIPKSQYIELFNRFLKIADLDQREYISIKTNNIEEIEDRLTNNSLEYFKLDEDEYWPESKLDVEMLAKKRNIIGSILSVFFSIFFLIVGFSNCYFSFYNLFLKRREEFLLYKAIGMDQSLLENIIKREKRKILCSFIYSLPFIIIAVTFVVSKVSRIFNSIDILLNLNTLFILVIVGYILIIYISISKIYDKYRKEII